MELGNKVTIKLMQLENAGKSNSERALPRRSRWCWWWSGCWRRRTCWRRWWKWTCHLFQGQGATHKCSVYALISSHFLLLLLRFLQPLAALPGARLVGYTRPQLFGWHHFRVYLSPHSLNTMRSDFNIKPLLHCQVQAYEQTNIETGRVSINLCGWL